MFEDIQDAFEKFEQHVPYADAAFLILKAHLVVETHLLLFIRNRASEPLYKEMARDGDGSYRLRCLVARALAEGDEIPTGREDILWPALAELGVLRNIIAHTLEPRGTKVQDKMRDFIRKVDPSGESFNPKVVDGLLHREFRSAVQSLTSLLVIHREPFTRANEDLSNDLR